MARFYNKACTIKHFPASVWPSVLVSRPAPVGTVLCARMTHSCSSQCMFPCRFVERLKGQGGWNWLKKGGQRKGSALEGASMAESAAESYAPPPAPGSLHGIQVQFWGDPLLIWGKGIFVSLLQESPAATPFLKKIQWQPFLALLSHTTWGC